MIVAMGGKDAEHYRSELKKAPVAWMYKAPPGLKDLEAKAKEAQQAKDKEDAFQKSLEGLTRDQKRKAEREFEEMLTERERQLRRFSFLQNAVTSEISLCSRDFVRIFIFEQLISKYHFLTHARVISHDF